MLNSDESIRLQPTAVSRQRRARYLTPPALECVSWGCYVWGGGGGGPPRFFPLFLFGVWGLGGGRGGGGGSFMGGGGPRCAWNRWASTGLVGPPPPPSPGVYWGGGGPPSLVRGGGGGLRPGSPELSAHIGERQRPTTRPIAVTRGMRKVPIKSRRASSLRRRNQSRPPGPYKWTDARRQFVIAEERKGFAGIHRRPCRQPSSQVARSEPMWD